MIHKQFPQVAVGAIIFKDKKVLLVKRSKAPAKGKWAVPGGRVQPGESMKDALKREIKEETNLDIGVGDAIYAFDVIEFDEDQQLSFHYVIIDFDCLYQSGILKAGDDAADARWVFASEFESLDVNVKTRDLLKQKYNFY